MVVVRKMRDKCKDAARMRREKERAEFVELSKLLPLPSSTTSQLDKASIIRLTSSYLRMRSAFPEGLGENWGQQRTRRGAHQPIDQQSIFFKQQHQHNNNNNNCNQIRELGSLILQTLDGFVFAMHKDGKIMYISETASVHLGLPQIDLTGSSVFEYVHPTDRDDIKQILTLSEAETQQLNSLADIELMDYARNGIISSQSSDITTKEVGRSFCMRMKCILPKRNAGLVSSGYKAIHCNGYLKVRCKLSDDDDNKQQIPREWESYALVAVGHSLLPTASTEVKLTNDSFMFRASLDFKFYYVESIMTDLLGFEQLDIIGESLYQFVHLNDLQHLEQSHRLLLDKGQVVTRYYRLMKKDGGFIWVQSYATLVNNPRNMPKPHHIVSICMILGDEPHDQSCLLTSREPSSEATKMKTIDHGMSTSMAADATSTRTISKTVVTKQANKSAIRGKDTTNHSKSRISMTHNKRTKRSLISAKSQAGIDERIGRQMLPKGQLQTTEIKRAALADRSLTASHSALIIQPESRLTFEPTNNLCTNPNTTAGFSIGSTRRASDDSCSVVSSVASTSLSSRSSSHHLTPDSYFLGGYSLTNQDQQQHHHHHHNHPQTFTMTATNSNLQGFENVHELPACVDGLICHNDRSLLLSDHSTLNLQPHRMEQQTNNNQIWSEGADEFEAPNVEYHMDNRGESFHIQQFVRVNPTSQAWMTTATMTNSATVDHDALQCSGQFGAPNTPPNQDYHHRANADDIYFEASQQTCVSYAGHSSTISPFNQIPASTNLYTV